ncbi:MAG TPA: hypothetical protein VFR58_13715 [Flavisolibacter sp.]|nr:hypothetical protein [Flavisolibacter sp.]
MKYFLITLMLVFFSATGILAKTDTPVSSAALRSFKRSFSEASDVSWTKGNQVYKVQFLLNNQYITASYNEQGVLISLEKKIVSTQLPLMLEANLDNVFKGYWITDLVEISTERKIIYTAKLENAHSKLSLRSYGTSWIVYQRTEK